MARLSNISILLAALRKNGWHITAFPFTFRHTDYIVLFEDLDNLPSIRKENIDAVKGTKYSDFTVLLTFIDGARRFQIRANDFTCDAQATEISDFFSDGSGSKCNIKDLIQDFYKHLNKYIPQSVPTQLDSTTRQAIVQKLSENEKESPNAIYCFMLRRNRRDGEKQYKRSTFNGEKARILCPDLYELFANEPSVSFCFNDKGPVDTMEILKRFTDNERS